MMEPLEMSLSLSPSCLNFHTECPHWYRRRGNKQGVTKRCRLSLLTNSSLVYESKCGGMGGGVSGFSTSQPVSSYFPYRVFPLCTHPMQYPSHILQSLIETYNHNIV